MTKTPEEFIALRKKYKPDNINLIFLFESPLADGGYFYDHKSLQTDILFKPMMKLIDFKYNFLNEQIKIQGLKKFREAGYYMIDSIYEPVNTFTNSGVRDNLILKNYQNLLSDLREISADKLGIPIILVRSNIFNLYHKKLKDEGFNVINESVIVPYIANNKEEKFLRKLMEIFMCQVIVANPELKKYYCSYGIPHEHSVKSKKVKAVILGSDPSNFNNNGKTEVVSHVFDLQNPKSQYFKGISKNIRLLELDKNNIYVQNLVRNYMTKETIDNKLWFEFSELWKPLLKEDLDKLDPKKVLPVFAADECVLNALLNFPNEQRLAPLNYYTENIIVKPEENFLERNLIPCFRGNYLYSDYPLYVKFIKQYIK